MGFFASTRERRYNAALAIHLAAYTFRALGLHEQQRVDAWIYSQGSSAFMGFSPIQFQRLWPPEFKAAWRAYAMLDLGIIPAVKGEVWRLPKVWRPMPGAFTAGPAKLSLNYRPFEETTAQAKAYLETKGADPQYLELRPD